MFNIFQIFIIRFKLVFEIFWVIYALVRKVSQPKLPILPSFLALTPNTRSLILSTFFKSHEGRYNQDFI